MANEEQPDLIITDIEMPCMDGIKMIARLRGQLEFSEMPILAVSGKSDKGLAAAVSAGAIMAIQKPVLDFDSIISLIKCMLPAKLA
jgi:CheY-like chemotaxis protein